MNWHYADGDRIVIGDSLIDLPPVSVNASVHVTTTVALDGVPMEAAQAVRVLLAQRSFLQQEVADLREHINELESCTLYDT